MAKRTLVIAALAFFIIFIWLATYSISDENFAQKETIRIINEGVNAILKDSSPDDAEIIGSIKINVPTNVHPLTVEARSKNGKKDITISVGFSALTRMIVGGYLMEKKLGLKNFGEEYAKYSARTFLKSKKKGGKAPWLYANLTKGQTKTLLNDPDFGNSIQGQHVVCLWYILAHEIAHHIYDHTTNPPETLEESRHHEMMADLWASESLIKIGIPPAVAFPSHMYSLYLYKYGVLYENGRTHPADLRRIRWMLKLSLKEYDNWNNNNKYFPYVEKEKGEDAFRRLLYSIEEQIMEETTFSQSLFTSTEYKQCFRARYQGCLRVCTEKYGNPLPVCKSKLCSSDRQQKIDKLRCAESVKTAQDWNEFMEYISRY